MWSPTPGQVIEVHDRPIARDGGGPGILWYGAIEAALHRAREGPFPHGDDLAGRAALLMRGLVLDHPFVDGNKRTAAMCAETFLERNGVRLRLSNPAYVRLASELAQGRCSLGSLVQVLRRASRKP